MTSGKRIDMGRLKVFVIEKLPPDSIVRELILSETDSLTPQEFLLNVKIWLKLFNKKGSEKEYIGGDMELIDSE
jgi:hypothetical protein